MSNLTQTRNLHALESFCQTYGIDLPAAVKDARRAHLDLERTVRMRRPFDLAGAARNALDGDPLKLAAKIAKDKAADDAETEALRAILAAAADRAAWAAGAYMTDAVEAALTGPTLKAAAADLQAVLSAAPSLPPVVREDDLDGLLLHTQVRRAQRVAEDLVKRANALPGGAGGTIEHSALLLVDPRPALEAGKPHGTVRAAVKGIAGSSDVHAWTRRPMTAHATNEPIYPLAPAALLVVRLGGTVSLAADLDEVDARHAAIAE